VRSHEKQRAKLALADEDCQYYGVDYDEGRSLSDITFERRRKRGGQMRDRRHGKSGNPFAEIQYIEECFGRRMTQMVHLP
jgi:hypothetical protein